MNQWERRSEEFEYHPVRASIKWGALIIATLAVLGALLSVAGFALGWFDQARKTAGPGNVTAQYQAVINDWEGLITAAQNACQVQATAHSSGDPVLVEDPALAYAATYRQVRNDFNTRQLDIFEAKLVGPRGYPRVLKVFPAEAQAKPDWCSVARSLTRIHS